MFKRKQSDPTPPPPSLFEGLLRGVPGGAVPEPAHEMFPSVEDLAGMKRFAFDPANPRGKTPLGLVGATMKQREMPDGRIASAAMGGHLLGNYDDRHRVLVAGSRSGKGRSHILPLLITDGENSILSIDPKGDHARETARYRATVLKQRVCVLDGFETTGKACAEFRTSFNPMKVAAKSTTADLIELATHIADAIIIPSEGRESHWDDTARQFLEGVILYVMTATDIPRPRNLPEVRHQIMVNANPRGEDVPLLQEKMCASTAVNGAIVAAATAFFGKEDRERSGTLSTLRKHLHFVSYPAMQAVLEDSDLSLADLLNERMTLYACLPATMMGPCAGFLRMFVNLSLSAFERNQQRLVHQHQTGGHRCIMVLDEYAALNRMRALETAAGQVAGLGCTLYPIIQDLTQLRSMHGERWETFLGNAGTISFFGNADLTTLSWIEKRLGTTPVLSISQSSPSLRSTIGEGNLGSSYSLNNHPLMTISEIARTFERDDPLARQLVILPTVGPVIMQRMLYDQHEAFAGYRSWMQEHA